MVAITSLVEESKISAEGFFTLVTGVGDEQKVGAEHLYFQFSIGDYLVDTGPLVLVFVCAFAFRNLIHQIDKSRSGSSIAVEFEPLTDRTLIGSCVEVAHGQHEGLWVSGVQTVEQLMEPLGCIEAT